jgi:hypothetical protein
MQTRSRMLFAIGAIALPLAIAGSASGKDPGGQPTTSTQECAPEQAAQAPKRLGVARLVGDAISSLCLSAADRPAVDQALENLTARSAAVSQAKQDLLLALADALESGSMDECATEEKIDAWAAVASGVATGIGSDLAQIHDVLDAGERQELADALASGIEQQREQAASGAWMDELAENLELSPEQVGQIKDVVKGFAPEIEAESAAHAKAIDALRGEVFTPGEAIPSETVSTQTKKRADRMVAFTEALIGILTPEQRARAAEALSEKIQA